MEYTQQQMEGGRGVHKIISASISEVLSTMGKLSERLLSAVGMFSNCKGKMHQNFQQSSLSSSKLKSLYCHGFFSSENRMNFG